MVAEHDRTPAERKARAVGRAALLSGSLGSLSSTAALMLCGAVQNGSAATPTNATSHWIWGERAMRQRRFSVEHTAVGYTIHHAASLLWATVYEAGGAPAGGRWRIAARAGLVAALAYFVDYTLTPRRLTPGFERHLPLRSRVLVYAAFAAGLAAPALWRDSRRAG